MTQRDETALLRQAFIVVACLVVVMFVVASVVLGSLT